MSDLHEGCEVLIVDDDKSLTSLLEEYLGGFGHRVRAAANDRECMMALSRHNPDIVILDVMLPGKNGLAICRDIREKYDTPILMLTARGELADKVLGLEQGADDYLAKPFEPRELAARIKSLVRRSKRSIVNKVIEAPGLKLETETHAVYLDGMELELTTMEFNLLKIFMENTGRVLSRHRLMDMLKGFDSSVYDRSVDMLICRLRQKLGDSSKKPRFIRTIRMSGYKFLSKDI